MTAIRITLSPDSVMPTRGSAGSSGYDLYATKDTFILSGRIAVMPTGVRIQLYDDSWEAQIRPRSGMSARGLWVPLGTIDSDYVGDLGVAMLNLTGADVTVKRGERIAQLVFARVEHVTFDVVEELAPTVRGTGGWGSTGR